MIRMKKSGFTLLELLVVIGILGILLGMVLPMLANAREQGNRAACLSNLREIHRAIGIYIQKQTQGPPKIVGNIRGSANLLVFLQGQRVIKNPRIFVCPSDDDVGPDENLASINPATAPLKMSYTFADGISDTGQAMVVLADDAQNQAGEIWTGLGFSGGNLSASYVSYPASGLFQGVAHKQGGNTVFSDNSVLFISGQIALKQKLTDLEQKTAPTLLYH